MALLSRRSALLATGAVAIAPGLMAGRSVLAAAPMQEPMRPSVYRFRLGEFEITTLLDGAVQLDGPHPIFGADQTTEAVAAHAEENFLSSDRMEISFTPTLVNTGEQLVLFDSGNGPKGFAEGRLVDVLVTAGYTPEQVDAVVITHFHGDHIGGLMLDGAPAFPNASYVTNAVEYDFWSHDDRLAGPTENTARLVRSNVVPLAERTTFIGDGAEVVPGITAVAAFGHTPGHTAYLIESAGRRLLLWADTSNHYVLSVQKPDWHVGFDMDKEAAVATRKRLFDMAAAERLSVTGYHMPFPAVGFVEALPDGSYRWVQTSYQLHL